MFPDDLVRKLLDEVDRSVQALEEEHRHHLEGQSVDLDIVNAGLALLDQIGSLWGKSDVAIRKRLQRFVFPDRTSFDGSRFGATVLPACLQLKEGVLSQKGCLVRPTGLEPVIYGSGGHRLIQLGHGRARRQV